MSADDYRILSSKFTRGHVVALEKKTRRRVILPERARWAPPLHVALLRGSADALRALADERFAEVVCVSPVVVRCPDTWTDDASWGPGYAADVTAAEAVSVALELVELAALGWSCGCQIDPSDAWIERDATGAARARAVAPLRPLRDHTDRLAPLDALWLLARLAGWRDAPGGGPSTRPCLLADSPSGELAQAYAAVAPTWHLDRQSPAAALGANPSTLAHAPDALAKLRALGRFASEPARAERACAALERLATATPRVPLDVDLAIALVEAGAPTARSEALGLAALYHRRACFRAAEGEVADAMNDATRAVALDAHPEYLTTLALLHERQGDRSAAHAAHDRAVAEIPHVRMPSLEEIRREGWFESSVETNRVRDVRAAFPALVARTYEARAAFLAAEGRIDEAETDLRASLAAHPTASAERRLARLRG